MAAAGIGFGIIAVLLGLYGLSVMADVSDDLNDISNRFGS